MKNKIIITLVASALIFSSCGKPKVEISKKVVEKSDFIVNSKVLNDFTNDIKIKKSGILRGKEELSVTSKTTGKIASIKVSEGQLVQKGAIIAKINDDFSRYYILLSKAKLNLEKAKNTYQTILENNKNDIKQAEKSLSDSNLKVEANQANINLAKAKKSLEIQKLNYQNLLKQNQEKLSSFTNSTALYYENIITLYDDIILFTDKLFGVTDNYKYENDDFELYLSAKDSSLKKSAEEELLKIIKIRAEIPSLIKSIDIEKINSSFSNINDYLENINKILLHTEGALKESIENIYFNKNQINGYLAQVNAFQGKKEAMKSAFLSSLKNPVTEFLNTYKNNQKVASENISITEKNLKLLEASLKTQEFNAGISLSKTKTRTTDNIKTAELAVKAAEISLLEAQVEYSKLTVKSPITGYIKEISVDLGEELSPNKKIVSLSSSNSQEININLSKDEFKVITTNTPVTIVYNKQNIDGKIVSISNVADGNLNYKATVKTKENVELLGGIVDILITGKSSFKLLPINSISIIGDNKGYIYTISSDKKIEKKEVELGKTYGEYIELKSKINADSLIILSDMKNYDEKKNNLIIKK